MTSAIAALLLQSGLPIGTWGAGKAKSLQSLIGEVQSGESVLVACGGMLCRELSVARINVYVARPDGHILRLVETKQAFLLPDGSVRLRVREHLEYSLSEKLHVGEDIYEAARRAVTEELGITSIESCEFLSTTGETVESGSYPGLTTRYVFQNFSVFLRDEDYREEYIEDQSSAPTDPKRVYFGWQPMAHCARCGGTEEPLDRQGFCWHCRL